MLNINLFRYNDGMNWARKTLVAFLAFLLFVCLLWSVSAFNIQSKLSHPDKVETWLADSKIYDHVVDAVLRQTQEESVKDGTSVSVAYTNPEVVAAAKSVFTPDLIRSNVNTFIDSNYAWLSGKTAKPEFSIDLTKAKQDFATKVGDYVTKRLASLPTCTPEQLAKLQIPVDPSSVDCRPASLDPATEGKRVAGEIADSSDFLEKPVVTADNLNQGDSNSGEPYYVGLRNLPKAYQASQKLAWIMAVSVIILSTAIVFIHPSRHKGFRRVGTTLVAAGVLLIAIKLVSDLFTDKIENHVLSNSAKGQLEKPVADFLHTAESQLTQSNMLFGIVFVIIGAAILIYLFTTREGRPPKPRQVNTPEAPVETPVLSSPENRPQPPVSADLSDRMRSQRPTGPPPLNGSSSGRDTAQPQLTPQKPRPPKPPRLIQ